MKENPRTRISGKARHYPTASNGAGVSQTEASIELDPVTNAPVRPDGAGMYLHWDGRKSYRTHMPVPRVLEPAPDLSYRGRGVGKAITDVGRLQVPRVLERSVDLSYGDQGAGNLLIEGDNLQVMVSLRPQYRSMIDVA